MKKINAEIFFTVALVILVLGGMLFEKRTEKEAVLTRYTATFLDAFDTKTEIIGYSETEEEFKKNVEMIKEKLLEYHRLFDIYNTYEDVPNLKTVNDQAGISPVKVNSEIIELLKLSKEMYECTEGKVNIAMGSVLTIWHDYRENGVADPQNAKLPKMQELAEASDYMDISQLIIDEEKSTVYLEHSRMSLDVGGIGKGYAVQKTAEYAKELGMDHLLLSVGGNVYAIGNKLDGTDWKVGIQNPDFSAEEQYVAKVTAKDCSVVTSGNYQRYYTVDGKRYCHIINPETLMPAEYFASVSIIAKDSGIADALSTAVYNLSLEEGMKFVNGIDGVEAMWVMEDGNVYYSDNFDDYLI